MAFRSVELVEVKTAVLVKDIMVHPVVMVLENDNIETVSKIMDTRDIGSIIVTDNKRNPVGIITEKDIVKRVTAKNLLPRKVKAEAIMSSPLVMIEPDADINEAAKKMSKRGIRRLVVMDGKKMVGILSSKDIVSITPALIEIIIEKARITQRLSTSSGFISTGYCDRCRQWSESLIEVDGRFLCEECRIEKVDEMGETEDTVETEEI